MVAVKKNNSFNSKMTDYMNAHPIIGLISIFIGLPAAILLSVGLCAVMASLPFALMLGWI